MVRYALGSALLFLAAMMACKLLKVGPFGVVGTAVGLSGMKLAGRGVCQFPSGGIDDDRNRALHAVYRIMWCVGTECKSCVSSDDGILRIF